MSVLHIDWDKLFTEYHCYPISITNIYDADTITCDIDLGFKMNLKKQKIRLYGINAPELRGNERKDGLRSRDALRDFVSGGTNVHMKTIKDKKGKYGRWLGVLFIDTETSKNINVNQWLVDNKFAELKIY